MPAVSKRQKRALLIRLLKDESGVMRVMLEDAVREKETKQWKVDCLVASKNYDEKKFDELDFDEKHLAEFGYYILSRLYAYKQCDEI